MNRIMLKEYKNGTIKCIEWHLKKAPDNPLYTTDEEFKKHIGEYYYKIYKILKYQELLPFFTVRTDRKVFFRKSLKALKKVINMEFKKYNKTPYYKKS